MEDYRENATYKALEGMATAAGISVNYDEVPADSIDGEIWARADQESRAILMPGDNKAFPNPQTAGLILGHEMGHIITGLESVDYPEALREINEKTCDLIGAYLYRLAEMTAENTAEQEARALFDMPIGE